MDYRQLSRFIGLLLLLMAVSMAGCLAYAVYDQEPHFAADRALGLSALITAAAGGLLRWFGRGSSLEILRREIKEYDEELARFPWKVVANKMDLDGAAEHLAAFRQRFPKIDVIPISADTGEGLDDLRRMLDNEVGHKLRD